MPNIKLKDGTGIERTYNNVQSITVPLADGTGNMTYGVDDDMLPQIYDNRYWAKWNLGQLTKYDALNSISSINIRNIEHMFDGVDVVDLGDITFNIDVNSQYGLSMDYTFSNCKIKSFPNFTPYYLYGYVNSTFSYCDFSELVGKPTDIYNSMLGVTSGFYTPSGSGSISGRSYNINVFDYSNAEELDFSKFDGLDVSMTYLWYFTSLWFLKRVVLPVPGQVFTSNKFSNRPTYAASLGDITFGTNNGTPLTASWKSQSMDFSGTSNYVIGAVPSNWSINGPVLPWINIYGADKAETLSKYNNVKNTDNRWFYKASSDWTTSYTASDGNTYNCKGSRLFSHFNHTSAVKLINSLPDTSEYLSQQGGTNSIIFHPASGGLTDEGEVGLLTAEEIAVATAKGWTVTFSSYTN